MGYANRYLTGNLTGDLTGDLSGLTWHCARGDIEVALGGGVGRHGDFLHHLLSSILVPFLIREKVVGYGRVCVRQQATLRERRWFGMVGYVLTNKPQGYGSENVIPLTLLRR